ncbi:DUF5694 domain-containing protein [Gracilibacillus salinarum]|uniref:DUF5694 domain-containing protein n=1 Tax=Gracilibacillus salinarum TaxID=2932255 RepID=A0ABY4GKM5_9BACI|nr:DUF5694 domain-containing protein [Gracilibacillus salinarum]UOQ84720.1 DUF5694 domain-containing protein [Gracilibacillus salinarum]
MNSEESVEKLEKIYLSSVTITDDKGRKTGFDFLNKWMERELMIFNNVLDVSDSYDRILLIIGSDHLWMLRRLFEGKWLESYQPF